MEPTPLTLTTPLTITGISARTTNLLELSPLSARIAGLWGRFFADGLAEKLPGRVDAYVYGVYSGYETDYLGPFDVLAGVAAPAPNGPGDWQSVAIKPGDYLVFTGHGAMPQTVVQTWGAIWRYFQGHPDLVRSYQTDFEVYRGPQEVAIHIGLKVG